jgi:RNA polymerase sigma factor (sigma-70 family)
MALRWQTRDARLIERVRNGDSQAFEQIYARYQPEILSFCRHLTGQREDAEDAVQHTFLSAYSQLVESEGKVELRPWLFTVARNRCLSLLRARGVRGVESLTDSARSVDGLASEVERRQELRDLVTDLGRLPEPQRAALLLSQVDSMSHGEIGAVLGVAPEKVKALVFQARSSLVATREAREAPCSDVRSQITTARGAALRRRTLRRHIHECQGCREFETELLRQRHNLDVLLPVIPTAGLHRAVLDALATREGPSTAAGVGGAGAIAAGSAGGSGGGLAGSLVTLGTQGVAKLAVVGVVAAGGTAGAVAADLPAQIQGAPPESGHEVARQDGAGDGTLDVPAAGDGGSAGESSPEPKPKRRGGGENPSRAEHRSGGGDLETAPGSDLPGSGPGASDDETGGDSGLPPGLAKKDELPPGLTKKDELPPGLAKKEGSAQGKKGTTPPGQAKKPESEDGGEGNGNGGGSGNGNGGGGNGQGNGGGGNGGGQGNSNGGGNGSANGGNGNGGQGNGNGGGNGNGNGGGNGH